MNPRNDHPISHHPKTTWTGQLVCPHCQTAFPITWRRYWSASWGNYRCLECRQMSHATANFWWVWPVLVIAMILGRFVGVLLSTYFSHNGWIAIFFFLMGALTVSWLLDKWMDGHLRHLKIRS